MVENAGPWAAAQPGASLFSPDARGLVGSFPPAGDLLAAVQAEWDAVRASEDGLAIMGLPRPWEPATCTAVPLRRELWAWLDSVVDWINSEHLWDPAEVIPACWPWHPHLVHEVAVLAEQRRRASWALSSEPLEEWQRVHLPAFVERMRARLRHHCDDGHQPGAVDAVRSRFHQATATEDRARAYRDDLQSSGSRAE